MSARCAAPCLFAACISVSSSKRIAFRPKSVENRKILFEQVVFSLLFTRSKPVPLFPSHSYIPIPNPPSPSASSTDTHTESYIYNSESSFVWRPLPCSLTVSLHITLCLSYSIFQRLTYFPRWLIFKTTKNCYTIYNVNCITCLLQINIRICYYFLLRSYTNVYLCRSLHEKRHKSGSFQRKSLLVYK